MRKILVLGLLVCAACSDSGTMNNTLVDMAMPPPPGDMAMNTNNPDMQWVCFSGSPMSNDQFLNACTTAASDDVMPFWPTLAPNGVLPSLP
jgi:hypothetical protein